MMSRRPKQVVLALASLALASTATAQIPEARRIALAEQLQRSSVVVGVGRHGGSGFVATRDGWVITNAHVVRGFRRMPIEVRYGNGHTTRARVLAHDPRHDLAVLQPAQPIEVPPLPLGEADDIRVGQTVLAFGSPFGLEGTLTQGIVSARRDLPGIGGGAVRGLIQTDAPINPGNSGGPLVNRRGQVIGVNTAILSRTGGSHGIGFAVPVNYVRQLLSEVQDHSRSVARAEPEQPQQQPPTRPGLGRVWLGIFGDDYRAGSVSGVRVRGVIPGGPAAEAGILGERDPVPDFVRRMGIEWTGHIIVAVDGTAVRSLDELQRALSQHGPGEQAQVTLTIGPGAVRGEAVVRLQAPPRRAPEVPAELAAP